jgi:uncharacterized protein
MTIRIIPPADFVKGRWRNGRGVSWDIAAEPGAGADQFDWRFALAEISEDGPFSIYGAVDRIFTLVSGRGVDLTFNGDQELPVHETWAPAAFMGDVATDCRLIEGSAMALNLFVQRGGWLPMVSVIPVNGLDMLDLAQSDCVMFGARGQSVIEGRILPEGHAAVLQGESRVSIGGAGSLLYVGILEKPGNQRPPQDFDEVW